MRLSWNEIRARAAAFTQEWKDASYERGETQSFYNEFFDIFGVRRSSVARYEEHVKKLDNRAGFIDLFWPGMLLVEQKSAGVNLEKARQQAGIYFDALPEHDRPRYQLHCDFQTFELIDRKEREEIRFPLADLPQHVEKFGFISGRTEADLPRSGPGQHQSVRACWRSARRTGCLRLHRPRLGAIPRPHCLLLLRRRHRHFRSA